MMYRYEFLEMGKVITTSTSLPIQVGQKISLDDKRHIITGIEVSLKTNDVDTCRIYVSSREYEYNGLNNLFEN